MMYWGYLDSEDKTPPVIVTISALFSRLSFIWPAMLNVLIKKKQGNLILSNFFVNLSRILLLSKKKQLNNKNSLFA